MQKTLKRNYLKERLRKIIISFVLCFAVLGGVYGMSVKTISTQSAYAKPYIQNAPWLGVLFTPNSDRSYFSVTLAPLPNCPHPTSGLQINIFAIPGHRTIDQIPVVDFEAYDLPAPSIKLIDAEYGITNIHKLYKDNVPVTFSFDTSVFIKGEEYTLFAYYQDVSAECEHYFSELYYYTHLKPVPLPPDPVKVGHTFVGWFYDEDFTQPYIAGTPIFEDTQLYAKFEINKYTVTFNPAGGEVVDGDLTQIVEYGNSAIAPVVSRDGYNFIGWDKQFDNITGDITITAQWEIITYTVTFYVDGVVYDTILVEYGTWFFDNSSVQEIMQTLSAIYMDKENTILMSNIVLSEDTELYVDVKSSLRDWLDFALWFQKYWIWLAVGAGVLTFIIIVVIIKVKRG